MSNNHQLTHEINFYQYKDNIQFIHSNTNRCAELSIMDVQELQFICNNIQQGSKCCIINNINNNDHWLFFNRLFRHNYIKDKKLNIGRKLLSSVIKFVDDNNFNIFCMVNPYHGMDKKRLIKLYKEFGFVNIFDCKQYDIGLIRYYNSI